MGKTVQAFSSRILCLMLFVVALTTSAFSQTTCPPNVTVCEESTPISLTGGSPSGGTYSGTGVANGIFDPAVAGSGTHQITYSYTDGNNQTSSCNFQIEVISIDIFCQLDYPQLNIKDAPIDMSGCQAFSGLKQYAVTYTGNGVTNNILYPSLAGLGAHSYAVTVDDVVGCKTNFRTLGVYGTTCPSDIYLCKGSDRYKLTGAASYPNTGVYTGPGVSDGYFDPAVAGIGSHVITYSQPYDLDNPTPTRSCTFKINVVDGSIPRPFDDGYYCADQGITDIVPYSPSDTPPFDTPVIPPFAWSGPGVINTNQIDLAIAGHGYHDYTATIPNSIGCPTHNYRLYVASGDVFVSNCTANMDVDFAANPFPLPFPAFGGSDAQDPLITGIWYDDHDGFYGDGVSTDLINWFNPSEAGLGDHMITYFGYSRCSNKFLSCKFNITVYNLPVTLSAFSAKNIESKAELFWQTTEETNFDHFEIESSLDPKSDFKKIGEIMGNNVDRNYRYSDLTAPKGTPVYYRLKMVDRDGTYAYSQIEWILLDGVQKLTIFPNPASKLIQIEASETLQEINILDNSGLPVFTKRIDSVQNPSLDIPTLPSGTYILRAKSINGVTYYNKLVIK